MIRDARARDRMPRVVILVENLPVPLDRRVWQEARTLAEDGWDVTVIGPRGTGDMRALRERLEGVEILRYPQRAASGLAGYLAEYLPSLGFTFIWLVRTWRRGRIDIVHGCNPPDLFWLFGWLVHRRRGQYVFDQHDANPELSRTKFGERGIKARVLYGLTTLLERASYRTADLVIVPNESYGRIAASRGSVEGDRLLVVRNAPDLAAYRRMAAGISAEGLRVGYVGVLGSQDGLNLLIDAWRLVIAEPDLAGATLEIVGDGEARAALEQQASTLGLVDSVRFHGFLRPDRFVPILASCRFTVSPDPPTPFNQVSTMIKVVDSLAIGRAVVSFDLAETRLLVGDAARVVEEPSPDRLANAIASLLRAPAEAHRLGVLAAARADALGLSWDRSAEALKAGYRQLLSQRP